jgi:prepilin-type N-terminal cleavage/methylation domain-containing protein
LALMTQAADRFSATMKPLSNHNHGFTLIELLVVVAIIAILASIAIGSYFQYVDKAQRTVSISALETMRKLIESYAIDHSGYPLSIDFTTCTDQNSVQVMPPLICDQMKQDLYSIDSYTLAVDTYTVMSKAIDRNHTPMKMTGDTIVVYSP